MFKKMCKTKCKIKKTEKGYRYKCDDGNDGFCTVSTKGKEGGVSVLGSGIQGGSNNPTIFCIDKEDLRKQLEEKYEKEIVFIE